MSDMKLIIEQQNVIVQLAQELGFKKVNLCKSNTVAIVKSGVACGLCVLVDLGEPEIIKDMSTKSCILTYKLASLLNCFVVVVSNLDLDERLTKEFRAKSVALPIESSAMSMVDVVFGADFKLLSTEDAGSDYQFGLDICKTVTEMHDNKKALVETPDTTATSPVLLSSESVSSSTAATSSDGLGKATSSKYLSPSK